MRREKLGDVFSVKLKNGYKLFQWAYTIPDRGKYIRVFEGLYESIPVDLDTLVKSQHSYVVEFYLSWAYRVGLVEWLGNFPVPEEYPCPEYGYQFAHSQYGWFRICIMAMDPYDGNPKEDAYKYFDVDSIEKLPPKYQNYRALQTFYSVSTLLYMFDYNFNLTDLRLEDPCYGIGTDNWEEIYQKEYTDRVDRLEEEYQAKRLAAKKEKEKKEKK